MTKQEAESALAKIATLRTVSVAEKLELDLPRLEWRFDNPRGRGVCALGIDGTPTDAQLESLAAHLPVEEKDRAAALAALKTEPAVIAGR